MGKSNKVKETAYEKELATIYKEQWDYYETNIVPVENQVIDDAKASNDGSVYQGISDDANLGYQRSFAQSADNAATNMAANGIDPSSGKFKQTLSSMSDNEASVSSDAIARSQVAGQERFIDKTSNVMAMGQGQAQESVASLNDIAINSQRKAISDASNASQSKADTLSAIGMAAGAYASNSLKKPDVSYSNTGTVNAGFNQNNDFRGK